MRLRLQRLEDLRKEPIWAQEPHLHKTGVVKLLPCGQQHVPRPKGVAWLMPKPSLDELEHFVILALPPLLLDAKKLRPIKKPLEEVILERREEREKQSKVKLQPQVRPEQIL